MDKAPLLAPAVGARAELTSPPGASSPADHTGPTRSSPQHSTTGLAKPLRASLRYVMPFLCGAVLVRASLRISGRDGAGGPVTTVQAGPEAADNRRDVAPFALLAVDAHGHSLKLSKELSDGMAAALAVPLPSGVTALVQDPVLPPVAPATAVIPTHSFVITTPDAVASGRLAHLYEQVKRVGLPLPRVIFGMNISDDSVECDGSNRPCRFGLAATQNMIWRTIVAENIPSAWVFEDDVLFHDDFKELFPMYWGQVPPDYEVVYVSAWDIQAHKAWWGKKPWRMPQNVVGYDYPVWAAGCYIMSQTAARRLDAVMTSMVLGKAGRGGMLKPDDATADDFLRTHGMPSRPADQTWVVFQNTMRYPASYQGIKFAGMAPITWYIDGVLRPECDCEKEPTPACKEYLPIVSSGLAYFHHHCMNMTRFNAWLEHYKRWHPEHHTTTAMGQRLGVPAGGDGPAAVIGGPQAGEAGPRVHLVAGSRTV